MWLIMWNVTLEGILNLKVVRNQTLLLLETRSTSFCFISIHLSKFLCSKIMPCLPANMNWLFFMWNKWTKCSYLCIWLVLKFYHFLRWKKKDSVLLSSFCQHDHLGMWMRQRKPFSRGYMEGLDSGIQWTCSVWIFCVTSWKSLRPRFSENCICNCTPKLYRQ